MVSGGCARLPEWKDQNEYPHDRWHPIVNSEANQRVPHGRQVAYYQCVYQADHGFDGSEVGLTKGISFINIEGVDETKVLIRCESSLSNAQIH